MKVRFWTALVAMHAIDSCGWIEWTGFGAYCEAEAAYQLTVCVNGCYAQC